MEQNVQLGSSALRSDTKLPENTVELCPKNYFVSSTQATAPAPAGQPGHGRSVWRSKYLNNAVNHNLIEYLKPASQLILAVGNADQTRAPGLQHAPQLFDSEKIGFRIAFCGIGARIIHAVIESNMFKHREADHRGKGRITEIHVSDVAENIRDALIPETLRFRREGNNTD